MDRQKIYDLLLNASSDRLAEWMESSSFWFWFGSVMRNLEADMHGADPFERYLSRLDRLSKLNVKTRLTRATRFGDARSELEYIEKMMKSPGTYLTYSCGIGKKRDGMRLYTKPEWNLMNNGTGYGISKAGAEYANWLSGNKYDLKEMQVGPDAQYEKQRHEIARYA